MNVCNPMAFCKAPCNIAGQPILAMQDIETAEIVA